MWPAQQTAGRWKGTRMAPDDLSEQIAGVAALAEPVRRELYQYVAAQASAVSRDEASAGVGIPRHTAKFHLDKLVEEGLLTTEFRRLSGRQGPGAGRPTKLYRRSQRELSVALPERHYDLAGQLMAKAIERSTAHGTPVIKAVKATAAEHGRAVGEELQAQLSPRASRRRVSDEAVRTLGRLGYEPRPEGDRVILANCPFHALAAEHTELVCGMNLAMVTGLLSRLPRSELSAELDPGEGRCCVVLT